MLCFIRQKCGVTVHVGERVKGAWELEPVWFIFRGRFNSPFWHGPCLSKTELIGKTSNFYLFCMAMLHCYILTLQAIKDQTISGNVCKWGSPATCLIKSKKGVVLAGGDACRRSWGRCNFAVDQMCLQLSSLSLLVDRCHRLPCSINSRSEAWHPVTQEGDITKERHTPLRYQNTKTALKGKILLDFNCVVHGFKELWLVGLLWSSPGLNLLSMFWSSGRNLGLFFWPDITTLTINTGPATALAHRNTF